ncbi:MAG TPA: diguanylate cyclase [Alphaproteobacteria bacterium]|jgi:diguanylate cyclase (GGDEF)-like protein|nr:diguanylate cyclase [Alphaproteobacteria bacterium]
MALTVVPLAVSAVVGYVTLSRGVVAGFADVATRQRDQLGPTHHLQLLLCDSLRPLEAWIDAGIPTSVTHYRDLRQQVGSDFEALREGLKSEPALQPLLDRARDDWVSADRLGEAIVSVPRPVGDPDGLDLLDRYDDVIASAVTKLIAVYNEIAYDIALDHVEAREAYARTEWMAAAAAGVSLLTMIAGVLMIGRILIHSVDRLIDGAARFAAGDRDHRIEIHVPPELRKVAAQFNRMIVRIHDTEAALAEQAQRDGLTGLLNRRAFDQAIAETLSGLRRLGATATLVLFDLDHFKRINDTYGHGGGDEVLRTVSQTVRGAVRDIDKFFRIGGEEFALLLPGANAASARIAAERIRAAIAAHPVRVDDHEVAVTISGGIAVARRDDTAESVMQAADAALYRAKADGRNRVALEERASNGETLTTS